MEPDERIDKAIYKEIAVLERFYDRIMSCRVMIEGPRRHEFGGLYKVRIDLQIPTVELVVKHSPTLHATLQDESAAKKTKKSEPKRLHRDVIRAIHEAFQEMRRRLQDAVRKLDARVKQREPSLNAKIAKLYPDHGFLETADGREIYFHRNSVLDKHFDQLRIGSAVRFAEESGDQGPQASTVRIVHPTKQLRSAAATVVLPPARIGRTRAAS
jgi:cold shock CspA family protein